MKRLFSLRSVTGIVALLIIFFNTARAQLLLDVTSQMTSSDSLQQGRLSRNLIAQDWTESEPFPGITAQTQFYHYRTFTFDAHTVSLGAFIQISFYGPAAGFLFTSAYSTAYEPNSVATGNLGFDRHWLGDAGGSLNPLGSGDSFFQVQVPTGESLVVVINETTMVLPINTFSLLVESFSDIDFSPPALTLPVAPPTAVPEPSTFGLAGGVMLISLISCSRRRKLKR